jgi:hypothetical protein
MKAIECEKFNLIKEGLKNKEKTKCLKRRKQQERKQNNNYLNKGKSRRGYFNQFILKNLKSHLTMWHRKLKRKNNNNLSQFGKCPVSGATVGIESGK